MKNWLIKSGIGLGLLSLVAFPILGSSAEAFESDLAIQYVFQPSSVALTTEKVWNLDPDEMNPHRSRWTLQRQTDLVGLEAVKRSDGRFGVHAAGLAAVAKSYLRPAGPWYRPVAEFPCSKKSEDWFATEDGSKAAVQHAADLWRGLLSERRAKLRIQLNAISAGSDELALAIARQLFVDWLSDLERDWRFEVNRKVREQEWAGYRTLAKSLRLCAPGKKHVAFPWDKMMEPVTAGAEPKLLVRAPARRWNGLYSVRLDVMVGAQRLNGQFLVDSSARTSVISRQLFENQGVLPASIEKRTGALDRVGGVLWGSSSGLARRVQIDQVLISGKPLPIREFLLYDTEFFDPPAHAASCCDGVLGADFLSNFVVEFSPGPPVELKIWERANYRAPEQEYFWTEMAFENGLISGCELVRGASAPTGPTRKPRVSGARWNTSNDKFLETHTPWSSQVGRAGEWSLKCQDRVVAVTRTPSYPEAGFASSGLDARYPGVDVGMALLGVHSFIFDLPHGRLWLSNKTIQESETKNDSGLVLKYVFEKKERVLRVEKIAPGSPASPLLKAGLKPGMKLAQINSRDVGELDQWEVDQILGGNRGPRAEIRWETRAGAKVAPISLR